VAKEDETLVLIDEVLTAFGRLDVWVCSSGLLGPPSIAATTPDSLQQLFEAHSLAPFFALKYAPPAMAKLVAPHRGGSKPYPNAAPKTQRYGSIVVVSSVASTYGGCWGPGYTMAAHAALGVVRAGVAVLKGSGVRINCVSAGQVDVGVDLQGVSSWTVPWPFPSRWSGGEASKKMLIRGLHAVRHEGHDVPVPSCSNADEGGTKKSQIPSLFPSQAQIR
jgi:NAD(P)-dependent dehydrogenase (short-subunit alcohol dehydrogenase family)